MGPFWQDTLDMRCGTWAGPYGFNSHHRQACMGQMGKWLRCCTTAGLDIFLQLRTVQNPSRVFGNINFAKSVSRRYQIWQAFAPCSSVHSRHMARMDRWTKCWTTKFSTVHRTLNKTSLSSGFRYMHSANCLPHGYLIWQFCNWVVFSYFLCYVVSI